MDERFDHEHPMYQSYEDDSWREDVEYDRMMQDDLDNRQMASTTGMNPREDELPEVKNAA